RDGDVGRQRADLRRWTCTGFLYRPLRITSTSPRFPRAARLPPPLECGTVAALCNDRSTAAHSLAPETPMTRAIVPLLLLASLTLLACPDARPPEDAPAAPPAADAAPSPAPADATKDAPTAPPTDPSNPDAPPEQEEPP